jgi:hypothetical protein
MNRKHNDTDMYTKLLIRWLMDPKLSSPLNKPRRNYHLALLALKLRKIHIDNLWSINRYLQWCCAMLNEDFY